MDFLIIKGALLIDSTGPPPIQNGMVRIEGDRIATVGPEKEIASPVGFHLMDCEDQVLIPSGKVEEICHGGSRLVHVRVHGARPTIDPHIQGRDAPVQRRGNRAVQ